MKLFLKLNPDGTVDWALRRLDNTLATSGQWDSEAEAHDAVTEMRALFQNRLMKPLSIEWHS